MENWTYSQLKEKLKELNINVSGKRIDDLNATLQSFNEKYKTNKSIARVLDVDHDDNGFNVRMSQGIELYLQALSSQDYWKNMYLASLQDLQRALPRFTHEEKTISEYIEDVKSGKDYKNTKLYEYFIKSNFAKENVLINTVGLPMAHKGKGETWDAVDSGKHLTMTKRMVAMTSTSHYCIKNLINGLPNKINTLTFDSGSLPMFVYSADTANGSSSEEQHDT
jgi:hypothetical protein